MHKAARRPPVLPRLVFPISASSSLSRARSPPLPYARRLSSSPGPFRRMARCSNAHTLTPVAAASPKGAVQRGGGGRAGAGGRAGPVGVRRGDRAAAGRRDRHGCGGRATAATAAAAAPSPCCFSCVDARRPNLKRRGERSGSSVRPLITNAPPPPLHGVPPHWVQAVTAMGCRRMMAA